MLPRGGVDVPGKRSARKVMLRAEAVWDRLNRLNMTQNELAGLLGTSSGHLSRLINGKRCASPSMRRRLMEVLGCSEFDELFVVVICDE